MLTSNHEDSREASLRLLTIIGGQQGLYTLLLMRKVSKFLIILGLKFRDSLRISMIRPTRSAK